MSTPIRFTTSTPGRNRPSVSGCAAVSTRSRFEREFYARDLAYVPEPLLKALVRPLPELPSIRDGIAEEFDQPSPQISYAKLMLFEPGGRDWFYVSSIRTLLADC